MRLTDLDAKPTDVIVEPPIPTILISLPSCEHLVRDCPSSQDINHVFLTPSGAFKPTRPRVRSKKLPMEKFISAGGRRAVPSRWAKPRHHAPPPLAPLPELDLFQEEEEEEEEMEGILIPGIGVFPMPPSHSKDWF